MERYRVRPEADDQVDMLHAATLAIWWGLHRVRSPMAQPAPPMIIPKLKGLNEMTWDEVLALER